VIDKINKDDQLAKINKIDDAQPNDKEKRKREKALFVALIRH
jgi:hypothetical protein